MKIVYYAFLLQTAVASLAATAAASISPQSITTFGLGWGGCTSHSQCGSGKYCFSCHTCSITPGCTLSDTCRSRPSAGDCAPIANCYRDHDAIDGQCPGNDPNDPCHPNPCPWGQTCSKQYVTCVRFPCYPTYKCSGFVGGGHHCGTNEEWVSCGSSSCWEQSCFNPITPWPPSHCDWTCKSGCRCISGYKRGFNNVCTKTCYWLGRPYSTDKGYLIAPVVTPSLKLEVAEEIAHVNCTPSLTPSLLPEEDRTQAANYWSRSAMMEHASVASFSRFSLELMSVGAPTDLLALAHKAALDEVHHTHIALDLANEFGGSSVVPGALPLSPKASDFAFGDAQKIATSAALEGCIEETLAAAVAAYQAEHMGDSHHQELLRSVATDEASHAALAWRAVKWLTATAPEIHKAVSDVFANRAAAFTSAPANASVPTLQHLGLLDQGTLEKLHYATWHGVVTPAAVSLGFLPKEQVKFSKEQLGSVIARALA